MFRHLRPVLVAACVVCVVPASADEPTVPLKKGEKIVFLGDSITQQGDSIIEKDETKITGYVRLLRDTLGLKHKDIGAEVIGAGISGNKVPDLQRRVDKDVIAKKPTLVFIYIGINDVWHGEKDPARGTSPEKYEEGLKEVVKKITEAGARVVLCTPSVIGEKTDGSNPLDKRLDEYAEISRKVAKELKVPVCDLRKAFLTHLKENNPTNKRTGVLTGDGVHLNAVGNRFVAEQMLKMFGD
jgi:lysophospholipase L1-like esterase